MDLDDIGYFGLPINGVATPSVQGLRKPKSTARVALTGAETIVACRNNGTAMKQLQHEQLATPKPSNRNNRKKRGLPSLNGVAARQKLSSDDEVEDRKPSTNADAATTGARATLSFDNASILVAKSRLSHKKDTKFKQRNIQSFFRAHCASSQHNHLGSISSAPPKDFVSAASMIICDNDSKEPESKICMQQDSKLSANRRNQRNSEYVLENSIEDETSEIELEERKDLINGECEKIFHSRERRRLNRVEFGIHQCILGHRILATATSRTMINGGKRNRTNQTDVERRMQEQRLLHGTCGVNILSRLVQRSCISSSTSSIAFDIEKIAYSGINWNICTTVELAASEDDDVEIAAGDVTAMSFDRDGVLLATGDDRGVVRIYDFDDVAAEDMKKRNETSRSLRQDYSVQCTNEREVDEYEKKSQVDSMVADDHSDDDSDRIAPRSIPPSTARPVLSFQCNGSPSSSVNTGHRISSILWSPYNQDHLVVSFA